ncbi:MAG: ATP-binding protein [Melioribacter sp.]|uniref:ATP-binding protein n=1 Tax=Rosettibacter primus TaxID=3111523 RepID=UPI00247BE283|nr:ATP-binding protein [Melioribacter sp.]
MEKVKFRIFPRLLDNIGLAMYNSIPKAISELVANCYDADASEVFIDIKVDENKKIKEIIIEDNGCGMLPEEVKNIYLSLGYNKRNIIQETPKYKRKPIGNKGIGKLAGLGIAKIMKVITFKEGIKSILEISRNYFEDKKDLNLLEFPLEINYDVDKTKCGTKIYLINMLEHALELDTSGLREFLIKEFGLTDNFYIYVNKQKLSPLDIKGERREIKDKIEGLGVISGKIVIAEILKDVKKPGIITYVRGRAIEGPTLYDINTPSHYFNVANRIIGEINADFLDPDNPEMTIDNFIISTSRDSFNKSHPKYQKYKTWVENLLIKISRELEKKQADERIKRINQNPNIQRILKNLPKPLREKFEDAIKTIIPRLNNLSDDNANTIIEFIARLAETESMLQILESLNKASARDIENLSKLLEEWGIYEITALSNLIKNRLEVIKKINEMINSSSTKEFPNIHKILEKNLWILDDNYKLYSSNQQLKTILQKELLDKNKHKLLDKNKRIRARPDLICKNLLDRYLVIELKRPSYNITIKDYPQVMLYNNILKNNFPNSEKLDCYLIGKKYDSSMSKEPTIQGKVTIYLKSYNEIIEEAKRRYEEILKIFEEGRNNE